MIIGTNQRNPMIFDPYRLNLNTGEMTMLCRESRRHPGLADRP